MPGFHHEALLYRDEGELLEGTVPFIRAGLAAGEPVMVAVPAAEATLIAAELDGGRKEVRFVDMAALGRNPARIIPAWRRFAVEHGGRSVRGIGEPIWPGRTAAEIAESQRHEALLNLAFDDGTPLTLLCPYDVGRLSAGAVREAERNHPCVAEDGRRESSAAYRGADAVAPFAGSLPPPPPTARRISFAGELWRVRRFVADTALDAGLDSDRASELAIAANELATNSIRHGGGGGTVRAWPEPGAVVCEVSDAGAIDDRLAGRVEPAPSQVGGRGLWVVNHLCDLVQIRSSGAGTTVRVRIDQPAAV
jgi:anti-sigma regulatory factor (Ser/Thr protein kinase)